MRSWWLGQPAEDALSDQRRKRYSRESRHWRLAMTCSDHPPPDLTPRFGLAAPRVSLPALAASPSSDLVDRAGHARGKAHATSHATCRAGLTTCPTSSPHPAASRRDRRAGLSVRARGLRYPIRWWQLGGRRCRAALDEPVVTVDVIAMSAVLRLTVSAVKPRASRRVRPSIEHQLQPTRFDTAPLPHPSARLGGWLPPVHATLRHAYTHIDDLTESLRIVTPVGSASPGGCPEAVPTTDRLFGSEGTLGIITEAWMRLQQSSAMAGHCVRGGDDWAAAVAATRTIAQAGLYPANCRLLDPAEALLNAGTSVGGGLLVLRPSLVINSPDRPVAAHWAAAITAEHGAR